MTRRTSHGGRRARRLLLGFVAATLALTGPRAAAQPPGARRPSMEQLAAMVQQRLGLTDGQAMQLRQSTRKFAAQRERLVRDARAARRELRGQVQRRESADQRRVAVLVDTLVALQRRRIDLLAAEQRELSQFLSPVQRAEFLAMQERAFGAAQQARMRRDARGHGPGGGRRPWAGGRPDSAAPPPR